MQFEVVLTFLQFFVGLCCHKLATAQTECYSTISIGLEDEDFELSYTRVEDTPQASRICPWTIRANGSSTLTFEVLSLSGPSPACDAVLSVHFFQTESMLLQTQILAANCQEIEGLFTVSGPLAFVTFASNYVAEGFTLAVRRANVNDPNYPATSTGSDVIFSYNFGKYSHFDNVVFKDVSSLIIAPEAGAVPSFLELSFPESCRNYKDQGDPCDAFLDIYSLRQGEIHLERALRERLNFLQFWGEEMFIIVYRVYDQLEEREDEGGFEVTWKLKTPSPATACGRVIDLSREGVVEYTETDVNETLRYGQQCVWTIRAPGIQNVKFTVEHIELNSCPEDTFYVSSFKNSTDDLDTMLETETHFFQVCDTSNESTVATGPLLFLVFVRHPGSFRIRIEAANETSPTSYPVASNYSDLYLTDGTGTQYWHTIDSYSHTWMENQYTTFLLNPDPFLYNRRTKLQFPHFSLGQEDSCWTANFLVFEIRRGLHLQYMLCDEQKAAYINIFADHSILILLRTGMEWGSWQNQLSFTWEVVV